MAIIHRNNDIRTCGALTIASQSKFTIGGQACALVGDVESHGGGAFLTNGVKMTIGGKSVIRIGDAADTDNALHPNPAAATGFSKMTVA